MHKIWNFLAHVARILTGLVFMFSGMMKGIDPLGSAYKFGDYFHAFKLTFLDGLSLPFSFLLSGSEFLIGAALLLNIAPRVVSWFLTVYMSFFTILTLILALTNPVSDCGCFGDALVITNWQTFYKNIVLMVLTLLVLWRRKELGNNSSVRNFFFLLSSVALFAVVSGYGYKYLPVIDFRPYKTGTYLPDNMKVPKGMPEDEFETKLIYAKDGVNKEFTLDNYPWQDSTWKWKETKTVLTKKGYQPPIHDFVFSDANGNDFTKAMLADTSYTLLMIAYDLKKADVRSLVKANHFSDIAHIQPNFKFVPVTASVPAQVDSVQNKFKLRYAFNYADGTMLKTVIRSNPGLVLLHSGTVMAVWPAGHYPDASFFKGNILPNVITMHTSHAGIYLLVIVFACWLVLLLVVVKFTK
jgi:uncharacterized membrane protein YphA (DoxX/SURF4 family)